MGMQGKIQQNPTGAGNFPGKIQQIQPKLQRVEGWIFQMVSYCSDGFMNVYDELCGVFEKKNCIEWFLSV